MTVLEGVYISIYINLCLMVAEVAVLAFGPRDHHRETLDTLAHILTGPISSSDSSTRFNGIALFLPVAVALPLRLWEARPSLIRVCPTN